MRGFICALLFDLHSVRVMKFWLAISIAVVIIDFATAGMEAGVNAGRLYWVVEDGRILLGLDSGYTDKVLLHSTSCLMV